MPKLRTYDNDVFNYSLLMYIMEDKKISPMSETIRDGFHFPDEIKTTIGSLRHPLQWRILELLISNNDKLSYTQLRTKLGFTAKSKGDLNYHLNELEKSGWIFNESEKGANLSDRYSSYYKISEFGLKLIEGIMKSVKRSSYKTDPFEEIKKWLSADEQKKHFVIPKQELPNYFELKQSELARRQRTIERVSRMISKELSYDKTIVVDTTGFEIKIGSSSQPTNKLLKERIKR